MAANFAIEPRGGAPTEKREREEHRWLELQTCSPTPGRLCDAVLRLPITIHYSSEPLRRTALRLPRARPSAARLCATHPPIARLR